MESKKSMKKGKAVVVIIMITLLMGVLPPSFGVLKVWAEKSTREQIKEKEKEKNDIKNKLDDKMIELLNTNFYHFPDQDVINLICRNRIHYVDNIYNSNETTGIVDNAKILHYIRGNKGWIEKSPRSEIWYNYHKEMIGGNKMDNYYVIAKINFNDYEGKDINNSDNKYIERIANESKWWCSAERYNYLKEHDAVELIEIKKVELPKETKKATINKTKKSKK